MKLSLPIKLNIPRFLNITLAEKKILFAVLSILTGLCTVAFFLHRNSQRLIASTERVERVEAFKNHLGEILSISVVMESGVRGYVVTGDEDYLEPPNKAIAKIFLHLHKLEEAQDISERHAEQIERLTALVDEKSSLATRTIETRRIRGKEEAMELIAAGKGKELMDQIRNVAGRIMEEEEANLNQLKEKHINAISNFGISFYFMLLKISITVITVVFLFVLYFRKRNKAEKTLKDTKELFYNVLDHTGAIISIKDLAGRYILINKTYEDLIQIPRDKVKGKTVYDLFEKDIADAIRDTDLDVIKQQGQLKIHELVPKDGELRHFESLKFPLFDANQIPYALCCISTDETEKIQAELQHQEQMNKILDLFNNAPCGYQSTNRDGIITEMNDTLLKWLGYTREEVIGKMHVRNLISKESLDLFAYYFPRFRTGELTSVYDVEVTYLRKNGSRLRVIANSMAHLDEDGNFQFTRTSIFDISFRNQVEELMAQN